MKCKNVKRHSDERRSSVALVTVKWQLHTSKIKPGVFVLNDKVLTNKETYHDRKQRC